MKAHFLQRTCIVAWVVILLSGLIVPLPVSAAETYFSISGTVTLAGTNSYKDVTVTCGANTDITDADGVYTIMGVPGGTSCTVTPGKTGYEFDSPPSATVSILSADLGDVNFSGKPVLQGVIPAMGINGILPTFQWLDSNLSPGWYQLVLESDLTKQGLWSPAGETWFSAGLDAGVCRVVNEAMSCIAKPFKVLAGGYYRWRVRSSSNPLVWSDYKNFQVKKPVYAPRGAQGVLPADGSIEFRWVEMWKVINLGKAHGGKGNYKANHYRIILLSGQKKLLNNPRLWYEVGGGIDMVNCAEDICSITLNNTDFVTPLTAGNYQWKVVPLYTCSYSVGSIYYEKEFVGAAVGEAFSFSATAPEKPLVMDKLDMAAASVSGVSEPYFTWVAPSILSATDKYEVTIEQMNPVSHAWKKVKGGSFSISKPKVVNGVDVFRCTPGASCIYYPGGASTWKAGVYRWAVRYVIYPDKIAGPYAVGLTAGVDPSASDATIFRINEPFFTPQPIAPNGGYILPLADDPSLIFTWEADPSEIVSSSNAGSKYELTIYTPKGRFSVDVAPDACASTLCSYKLTRLPGSMTTPNKYPSGYLDYGAYGFSLRVALLKSSGLDPTLAESWAYGKGSAKRLFSFGPLPVTNLVVTQTVTTKNPRIIWTDADPENTTGFRVLVERYDRPTVTWVKVASTLLKSKASVCRGTTCSIDYGKAKPWCKGCSPGLTYRVWVTPFKITTTALGPAVIQEFILP